MELSSGCGVCGKKDGVLCCSGCKVMMYCGVEHQIAQRQEHKSACSAIRRCRVDMEKEEKALRDHPGNPFTYGVGNFWTILSTRPYMRSRAALCNTMSFVNNVQSLQEQLNVLMETLRLCRGDNMGARDVIPGLMIRLQQDQECYDFLKWWATTGQNNDYDWGNTTLPYLDIKNANPLEPVDMFCGKLIDLTHIVSVTLVKVKVLQVILTSMGPPGSVAHMLGLGLQPSSIAKNPNITNCDDGQLEGEQLKAQIRALYEDVQELNPHFWPALLNPGEHLEVQTPIFSIGSVEQMRVVLNLTYEAWYEAPGAIAFIEMAVAGEL
ncbi:Zinc finger, MYND-type [Penicillium expansum]|uniref:Zinc finger, MYND-type n=1 Tax=Penicillium expansum TaxID=27334 RepID=A0A0A2I245_PENEN|nr:Zinc finger, MYND-type [Penicillium expansum]KGO37184.1 Zinc finger, MYND-type [Penicillium expansum]KGO54413.1 Zinc finger, MYND-type [Penicillium expansum]KGO61492.1 Zinc finger, MYND-type [Penicillium expansum]